MPPPSLMTYRGEEPYLFASYAHSDADAVVPELIRLDALGFRIWYDEGITPTEEWVREIADAITACSLFLIFLSPSAIASTWVRKEISFALKKGKKVLPIYLAQMDLPGDLELQLGNIQALERFRFTEDDYHRRLLQLLETVEGVNRRQPPLEQQKLERELELAFRVQQSFFPRRLPSVAGYEFWASYLPARSLSGDYLHIGELSGGAVTILLTEVSGKGVPSALCSALLAGAVSVALPLEGNDLSLLLNRLNRLCCQRFTDLDCFATVLAVRLDPAAHRISILSAGAGMPFLRSAAGELVELSNAAAGLPLGLQDDPRLEVVEALLQPGDCLFLSNASLADLMNEDAQLYGRARLRAAVRDARGSPREIGKAVVGDVNRFLNDHPLQDDFTVVGFGRNPVEAGQTA